MNRGLQKNEIGLIHGIDVSAHHTTQAKAKSLVIESIKDVEQYKQLDTPDAALVFQDIEHRSLLSETASINYGSKPGQTDRVVRFFWELERLSNRWQFLESTPSGRDFFTGKSKICLSLAEIEHQGIKEFGIRSPDVWGKPGIVQSQMNELPFSIYCGNIFDNNTSVLHVVNDDFLSSLLVFLESGKYLTEVRKLNQKLDVAAHTMVKVPFDLKHWTEVAKELFPSGLPQPYSNDPTQWLFHGHPCGSVVWSEETKHVRNSALRLDETVLQVAVARLLGYRWPAEMDPEMELAAEQREWVNRCEELLPLADEDGIVPIPSLRGEDAADDRLREMLATAYGSNWSPSQEQQLLSATSSNSADLGDWLRNQFFESHCKIFQHRPFIWHIWDGRKRDGFHALLNYHKLTEGNGKGRQLLEKLTYGYLGDWIILQKDGVKQSTGGAEDRLTAAQELEKRLKAILEGEPPYDIFVRWKPLSQQPIGWEPDVNDGVRLNIRPFLADDIPGGKRGAGILRAKPNINWNKDRGKDTPSAPWYNLGPQYGGNKGDRINDHHLTNAEKRESRKNQQS
jgi:hypothetical protein